MKKTMFLEDGVIINPKGYPMLEAIAKFEKRKIKTDLFFEIKGSPTFVEDLCEEIVSFFKHASLKEALKDSFGFSGKEIINFWETEVMVREEGLLKINLNYFLSLRLLSYLFTKEYKNHANFLKCLSNPKIIAWSSTHYVYKHELLHFLSKNFTENQWVDLLSNASYKDYFEDLLGMYYAHEDYYVKFLAKKPFEHRNSFLKIHDLFYEENKKLRTVDFQLNQESKFENLKELGKIPGTNYRFEIPKSYHELIDIGNQLGHCIGSLHFAEQAKIGKTTLLSIFEGNNILYSLEIKNQSLVQIQGKSRTRPRDEVMRKITQELEKRSVLKAGLK